MEKTIELLAPIQLVGITARTNNAAEMNPATGKIGPTLQRYFQNNDERSHDLQNTVLDIYIGVLN
jgi:hypothetical protein